MVEPYLPVYINGEIISADQARVSVFDRGFMRGDGVFETLRTYSGELFKLDQHLARLDHGMEVLRFPARSADLGLKAAVLETVKAVEVDNARVRVQVTRGCGTTGFTAHADTAPTVIITVHPITQGPAEPLKVITASVRRDERSPLVSVKTINYIPSILALMEAHDAGADDAILLNYAGNVAEGCASNVFLYHSGKLITPDLASGVLPGIIRATVIEIAESLGIPVEEKPVDSSLLESADEIFMTSSTREVAPVAMVNGKQVGQGSHDIARLLENEYRKLAEPG
ncbi:MAG TPA: aminotransferase class IV [Armatimonadota bacterium]|nr:aminotransferase class IV [Armatimonadota bacterium]